MPAVRGYRGPGQPGRAGAGDPILDLEMGGGERVGDEARGQGEINDRLELAPAHRRLIGANGDEGGRGRARRWCKSGRVMKESKGGIGPVSALAMPGAASTSVRVAEKSG